MLLHLGLIVLHLGSSITFRPSTSCHEFLEESAIRNLFAVRATTPKKGHE